jgi:hypothetical protein
MNEHDKKAETFINKLMANPLLLIFTPAERGTDRPVPADQLVQLCPTLASESYFPRETWPQILSRLSPPFCATDRR